MLSLYTLGTLFTLIGLVRYRIQSRNEKRAAPLNETTPAH